MDRAKDEIEASAEGTALGQSYKLKVVGTWAPAGVLVTVTGALLVWGKEGHIGTQLAVYLALVLLGVTLGVAFTSKRVEDWKAIAEDRKREIERMADEKNALVELKKRRTSARDKK